MATNPRYPLFGRCVLSLGGAALLLATGCSSPLDRSQEEALRESLIAAHRKHLQSIAPGEVVEVRRDPSDVEVELSDERRQELDAMSGVNAYESDTVNFGSDLLGKTDAKVVKLSLQEAVRLAMENNLTLQFSRLTPAVTQTQITQAESAFDATFFTTADWSKLDTPRPAGAVTGLAGDTRSEDFTLSTGIRKPLTTGGSVSVSTGINRQEAQPSVFGVNKFYDADVLVSLRQPLLRGFGTDVNRAAIVLSEIRRDADLQNLQQDLIDTAFLVEQVYWSLVTARQQLLIQQRLLERTVEDRDRLKQRAEFDVSPVRLTEANSFVELRRADVIRARQQVRDFSDALKRLINSPDLPVSDETLVVTVDNPIDSPIQFSLLDAVTTALRKRPALQATLLTIKDASVRQRVADNARLPVLNMLASVNYNGLGLDNFDDAYDQLGDGDYIDYILGAEFEVPIGNRGPEALYQQRKIERQQAVLEYQRLAQQTVTEVKSALRNVLTSYELIGATRAARRAAADSLRAIEEQEAAGVALTPEFLLDLKLTTQQRLADAETQEVQALSDYMTAIAQLYQVMGTLLERDQIHFQDQS